MSRRPTLREAHLALDKMGHHAYCKGRLVEQGDETSADAQHSLMLKERAVVLAYVNPRRSFLGWLGSLLKRIG